MKRRWIFVFLFILIHFPLEARENSAGAVPPWVRNLEIPRDEPIYLVVKGVFPNLQQARQLAAFIQQLMVRTPGDGVDQSDHYVGLPAGQYVVGMLFDSKERAEWWMEFSYRNPKISRGTLKQVKINGAGQLPYMPSAVRNGQKRLLAESEVLTVVQNQPDMLALARKKKLKFKFTDYPRNGDLRYEIEVVEERPKQDPLMIDFFMIDASNGVVTERYSQSLGVRRFVGD